jgi:hypothetical protein
MILPASTFFTSGALGQLSESGVLVIDPLFQHIPHRQVSKRRGRAMYEPFVFRGLDILAHPLLEGFEPVVLVV